MAHGLAKVVMIVAATVTPASAIAQQRDFITPGLTLQPRTSATKPFIFRVQSPSPAAEKKQPESTTTTVICGMTIVHPDPTIDPGIVKSPPDTKTTFTMKKVQPTVCAAR